MSSVIDHLKAFDRLEAQMKKELQDFVKADDKNIKALQFLMDKVFSKNSYLANFDYAVDNNGNIVPITTVLLEFEKHLKRAFKNVTGVDYETRLERRIINDSPNSKRSPES